MALDFYLDIENAAGVKQGGGPITSAAHWRYTARMDAAGDFAFTMPASDPKAAAVQKKLIARAWAMLSGQRVEVGAGIIDHISRQPQADGSVILEVSGMDLTRELSYRSVLNLKLYLGGNPVSHAAAVAAVGAFAPAGWTFTPDAAPGNNSVYGYFNGESVLAGMIKTGEKSQSHFYRDAGRSLIFTSAFAPSGVRAIQAQGDLTAATCAIVDLTETTELFDLITRIYPRGSGNAEAQLTLRASTRTAPAGFVVNKTANYIEHAAMSAAYGRIEAQVDFREIGPVANTTPDVVAAANMLFDSALETLKRRSVELDAKTYTVSLAGCSQLLRPMQTVRVVYRDLSAGLDVNTNLNILESTWEVSEAGIYTTGLTVSSGDRKPASDQALMVETINDGTIYQALQQLNANSYVTAYKANIDVDHIGSFRFRFGNEVTQLQQALFEFQLLPFESTVKSVGGSSGGSGNLPTTGPNTDLSGVSAGANNTSGAPSVSNSGAPSVTNSGAPSVSNSGAASGDTGTPSVLNSGAASGATGTPSVTNSGGPSVTNTGAVTGNTSAASGNTGAVSGNTGSSVGNTSAALGNTSPSTSFTGGPSQTNTGDGEGTSQGPNDNNSGASTGNTNTPDVNNSGPSSGSTDVPSNPNTSAPNNDNTGQATGGDTTGVQGKHQHITHVVPGAGNLGNVTLHNFGGGIYGLTAGLAPDTIDVVSMESGSHTHTLSAHTHTLGGHVHTLNNHTHDLNNHHHNLGGHTHPLGGHVHSLNGHTHNLSSHSHSLGGHIHDLNDHTHGLGSHVHDLGSHTHTLGSHVHDLGSHTHTLGGHTHDLNAHTHTLGGHTHDLNAHTHDLGAHTHTLGGHTHDLNAHTHTLGGHTHDLGGHVHTLSAHTHDLGAHTHSLNAHTHSLSNHTHSLADSISAVYGIFRESAANTYLISELQYRVNGGTWAALSGAVSAGGAWWQLDITALVIDATTLRPAQDNNLLEISASSAADKRVSVDAQLSIRNIIQAVQYA